MPNLFDDLGSLLQTADLGSLVSTQVEGMNGVQGSVGSLLSGPAELGELEGIIQAPPVIPGLDGLSAIGPQLTSITGSISTDLLGPIAPILGPLQGLTGGALGTGGSARIQAVLDFFREVLQLALGRTFQGASGMPFSTAFWGRDGMPEGSLSELFDIQQIRAQLAQAEARLDVLGERLDPAALVGWMQQGSQAFIRGKWRWPRIPLVEDVLEALATIENWKVLNPQQMTADIATSLVRIATLIDTPRTQVAEPVLQACRALNEGEGLLREASVTLVPVFNRLRVKVLESGAQPSPLELTTLEQQASRLEAFLQKVRLDEGPFENVQSLALRLERQMLRVVRTLHPPNSVGPMVDRLREFTQLIPDPGAHPLTDLVRTVQDFDISDVTGPLNEIKAAVESAVTAIEDAKAEVRDALMAVLEPVDQALQTAFEAIGLNDIIEALEQLPVTINGFVEGELEPRIAVVRGAISDGIGFVTATAEQFDPRALLAPIENTLRQAAEKLHETEVAAAFQEIDAALTAAVSALENFDLTAAANESIATMAEIEATLRGIDPALIPDEAKPVLQQAVDAITGVDFTGEVATPIIETVRTALREGPTQALADIDEQMQEVKRRIEAFKPSVIVGDVLEEPYETMLGALRQFEPSQLLERVESALAGLRSAIHIADVSGVLQPLIEGHATLLTELERLRPSNLLEPVEEAIEEAVREVFRVTRLDDVFDGINDVLQVVQDWVGLIHDVRGMLTRLAGQLNASGDVQGVLTGIVDQGVSKIGDVDLLALTPAFERTALAVSRVDRDRLAGELSQALTLASESAPRALASGAAANLRRMIREFPFDALRQQRSVPSRERLLAVLDRWRVIADGLDGARTAWQAGALRLSVTAGSLHQDLLRYHRLTRLGAGSLFDEFASVPANIDALRATVRAALEEGLRPPVVLVVALFQRVAPHVGSLALGLAEVAAAIHQKLDSIVGDDGIGGVVAGVENIAGQLRDLDFTPITGPLDTVWGRIEGTVQGLNPQHLAEALGAASAAVQNLLRVSNLVSAEDVAALDQAWQGVLQGLEESSPRIVVSRTLDPLYEALLTEIVPVLELPGRLQHLIELASTNVGDEVLAELGRVETAFDRMLQAVPLRPGGGSAGVQSEGSLALSA